jgi:hypothetical protein
MIFIVTFVRNWLIRGFQGIKKWKRNAEFNWIYIQMSGSTIIETVNHIQSIILEILPIMLSYCILCNNCFLWYQFEILYYTGNMLMVCDEMKYRNTLKTTDQSISESGIKYHNPVSMKYHLVGPSSIECIACTMIFIIIMTGKIIMHAISSIIDGHCMSVVIFFLLQNIITYSNWQSILVTFNIFPEKRICKEQHRYHKTIKVYMYHVSLYMQSIISLE